MDLAALLKRDEEIILQIASIWPFFADACSYLLGSK